jgi:hypothetical protein
MRARLPATTVHAATAADMLLVAGEAAANARGHRDAVTRGDRVAVTDRATNTDRAWPIKDDGRHDT